MTIPAAHAVDPSRRRLAAAHVALLILAAATAGLYAASLPFKFAEIRQVCAPTEGRLCALQLNAEQAARLRASGLSLDFYAAYYIVTRSATTLVCWAIALLIALRRPRERMALFTILLMITYPTNSAGVMNALPRAYPALALPVGAVQWTGWMSWIAFYFLFPDGRWVPRLRYIGWFLALIGLFFAPAFFFPGRPGNQALEALGPILFPALFVACLGAQVYRYRRVSGPSQRQQTKWVVYGVVFYLGLGAIGGLTLALLAPDLMPSTPTTPGQFVSDLLLNVILYLTLPLSIGVSILRYRLYDIDRLIRRTLIYSLLSGLLALTYFALVVGLQGAVTAVGGARSEWITVASTLTVAALIAPLRGRVQRFIDRRFYRKKYDAARTLSAFAVAARDETDLTTLAGQLTATLRDTLEPEHIGIWLRPSGLRAGARQEGPPL